MLFEQIQVSAVLYSLIKGYVHIARLFVKGKIDAAVHGKGENFRFLAMNPGRAVSLMYVEINDQSPADKSFHAKLTQRH